MTTGSRPATGERIGAALASTYASAARSGPTKVGASCQRYQVKTA